MQQLIETNGKQESLMTEKRNAATAVVDKRRTPVLGDRKVTLRLKESTFVPPFEKVTSVSVVGFTKRGKIVATEDKRGVDLTGGHVAEEDKNAEATGRREGIEEGGVRFGKLFFVRAIESDLYGTAPDELSYMVILTGLVTGFEEDVLEGRRVILSVEEFKRLHTALAAEMMGTLVDEAKAIIVDDNKR
jgi:8-oxo-dGTP diphosphatase